MFGRIHVLPVVTEFLRAYQEVDVRLLLGDRTISLTEEHVDLAIRVGELPDSSVVAMRLGIIRRVVCGSPAYFAERGAPERPDQLGAHACITFEDLMSPDIWDFSVGKLETPVKIHSRLAVNSADAAIIAAVDGIGITRVLSYQIEDQQRRGNLQIVLQEHEPKPWPVSLVYASRGPLPLKLRAFLDFSGPRLKARLAGSAE